MATVRFSGDFQGIGELLCSPGMVEEMRRRAEKVKAVAEATAPVDEDGPHPGQYKAAFSVDAGVREQAGGDRRAQGVVENSAPEALWVEVGSKNNPKHRTLGRALDAAAD